MSIIKVGLCVATAQPLRIQRAWLRRGFSDLDGPITHALSMTHFHRKFDS